MAKERNKTKATLINGKGSAFHNDRTYEGATEEQKEEIVAKMQLFKETEEKKNLNFYENELEYYNKNFSVWLNNENEKKRKQGNLNRIKTMEEILGKPNKGKTKGRYEPQETIYQLGNAEEQKEQKFNISDDLFKYCLAEFLTKIRKKYGKNMAILDVAIHKEDAIHAHVRRVWFVTDKDGNKRPAKKEALRELGFYVPKEANTKNNNETVLQTKEERQIWYDILKEHGIDLDEVPDKTRKNRLENKEYQETEEARKEAEQNAKTAEIRQINAENAEKTARENAEREEKRLKKLRKEANAEIQLKLDIQDDIEELRTQYKKEKEQYEKDKEQFNKNHLGKINAEDFENFMNLIPQYEEEQGIERT